MVCILAPFNPFSIKEILINGSNIPNINTSATSINNLVMGLHAEGIPLHVITLDLSSTTSTYFYGDNIKITIVGVRFSTFLHRLFPNLTSLSNRLISEVLKIKEQIDVIHGHWCYEYALAAKHFAKDIPVVITVRDFAPVIYNSIHPFSSAYAFLAKFYWKYKCKIFFQVISDSNIHLISNSEYTKQTLLMYDKSLDVKTIPNSIEDHLLVEELPDLSNRKNIISIAASIDDDRKNIKSLIEAFVLFHQRFPEYRLVLIGNFHKDNGIYSLVHKCNILDYVDFLGRLNRYELFQKIDSCRLMVHPALEETFGNILLEAMARGIPCIGGDKSGAVPYVLNKGESGILCNINSAESICDAMIHSINDFSLIKEIRINALKDLNKYYTNKAVALQHINYYKLISKKS